MTVFWSMLVGASAATPQETFARIAALEGQWIATLDDGGSVTESFATYSRDSVVLEVFGTPSGRETLTTYHLDGVELVLTHYCAMGNQPRLRAAPAAADTDLVFRFADATGLRRRRDAHLHEVTLRLVDADTYERIEVYTERREREVTSYRFTRVR